MKEKNKNEFHVAIPDEGMKKKNTRNSKIVKSIIVSSNVKLEKLEYSCNLFKIRSMIDLKF